jgi:hypothetical protein
MKINVQGFASEFTATFANAEDAQAFTGAMVDIGSPMTERETRGLALACGAVVVEILPEHVLLALDLAEMSEAEAEDVTIEAPSPVDPSEALRILAHLDAQAIVRDWTHVETFAPDSI